MENRKILIDEKTLQKRIKQLAEQITLDFKGQKITLLCILKGSLYFFADLTKRIDLDSEIEFVRISSYIGEKSTGKISLKLDTDEKVTGKNVLVVEDIIDTGRTLSYLMSYLSKQKPKSLKLCTLLDKPEGREVDDIKVDYVGFTIPDRFVIGYGLDLDQKYRNLPEIQCIINPTPKEVKQIEKDVREIKKQANKKTE